MPSIRTLFSLLPAYAVASLLVGAPAQSPPPGFAYQPLSVGSLDSATAMAFLPDGRLLLTERATGNIRVFADGVLKVAPWATIPVTGGPYTEQGLLGIAVDPAFLTNRYVYVYYTDASGTENRIARLREVNGAGTRLTVLSPDGAIPSILYHNGGAMVFGVDGKLYVATGDGLNGKNSQDLADWRGKVLRFDAPNLTIPADNPFPGSPVFSLGHRNHFGFAVHPLSGDIYQTENGAGLMDEVNRLVAGGNYGWPDVEGLEPVPNPAYVDPLAVYPPPIAPTGTCFYSGSNYPPVLRNTWFFTDYNYAVLHALVLDPTGRNVVFEVAFDDQPGSAYAPAMGPDGNLWLLTNANFSYGADELGRYVHVGEPSPSLNAMSVSNKTLGASVTVGVHGSSGGIAFAWMSLSALPVPVPTVWGNAVVPPDAVLSAFSIGNDDRGYLAVRVPNDITLLGVTLNVQGLHLDPGGSLLLTNATDLVVRG